MADIQHEMDHIRKEVKLVPDEERAASAIHQHQLEWNMRRLLTDLTDEFVHGDERLCLEVDPNGLGFTLTLRVAEVNPMFVVSTSIKGETVTVKAADGKWEQVHGLLGNYGNWTDQKNVYQGALDSDRVSRVLRDLFLSWYRFALSGSPGVRH